MKLSLRISGYLIFYIKQQQQKFQQSDLNSCYYSDKLVTIHAYCVLQINGLKYGHTDGHTDRQKGIRTDLNCIVIKNWRIRIFNAKNMQ